MMPASVSPQRRNPSKEGGAWDLRAARNYEYAAAIVLVAVVTRLG
jgi:hypothetical protein